MTFKVKKRLPKYNYSFILIYREYFEGSVVEDALNLYEFLN
jgi:hypothetical protein